MPEPVKLCPICDTVNHRNAMVCVTCGTTLTDVDVSGGTPDHDGANNPYAYDFRYGETDLYEDALRRKGQRYLGALALFLATIMCVGVVLMLSPLLTRLAQENATNAAPGGGVVEGGNGSAASGNGGLFQTTNTPRPTAALATVTVGPPTLTRTPTPSLTPTITVEPTREPCVQVVNAGEGLLDVAYRCGHIDYDMAIVPLIVELNELSSEIDIREGQSLTIPWPTSVPDPNAEPEASGNSGAGDVVMVVGGGLSEEEIAATQAVDPFFIPSPTLPPGIVYHTVSAGEDISAIIYNYDTSIDVLEQLNPEITFSQCEFGVITGGPRCVVILNIGQQVRVPVPTPTPTLSPTPSGSETPTPTPTATFNAPSAVSPSNRAYFRRDEFVTLRWVGSAALSPGQVYRVQVEDITRKVSFSADSTDPFFVLPSAWQGPEREGRYEYRWTISVVNLDVPDKLNYTTAPRVFTWEGLGEDQ